MDNSDQNSSILEKCYAEHPQIGYRKLMKFTGLSERICSKFLKSKRENKQTDITRDLKNLQDVENTNTYKSKYKQSLKEIDNISLMLNTALEVKSTQVRSAFDSIEPTESSDNRESTAVMVASDWHIDEFVDPETVNYMNRYDLNIAYQSVNTFFAESINKIKVVHSDVPVKNVVLALLGDLMSGYIHEELLENNTISPLEACIHLRDMIHSGINMMMSRLPEDCKITVVCNFGNHGRTEKVKKFATGAINNFEWMIYNILKKDFSDIKRVKFICEKGYHTYLNIYDYKFRFHHGDAIKYKGGIGGVTIPINKRIYSWNSVKQVDIDVMGHFHQSVIGTNFIVNGSIIGYNAYGVSFGGFERPSQTLFIVDKHYGKTFTTPIYIDRSI